MKRKVKEMQEEAERIEKMQRQAEEASSPSGSSADGRSIYIGSVRYLFRPIYFILSIYIFFRLTTALPRRSFRHTSKAVALSSG